MDLEQNYDALEPKPEIQARRIGRGDVLEGESGNRYLVVGTATWVHRILIRDGNTCGEPVYADNTDALPRNQATALCGGRLRLYRLIGRAQDVLAVLTVQDPGE